MRLYTVFMFWSSMQNSTANPIFRNQTPGRAICEVNR